MKEQRDPVCGMVVEEGKEAGKSEYKSVTYYFCSRGCKVAFDKNPEEYLKEGPSKQMVG
jgi:YHS domain-containing protein